MPRLPSTAFDTFASFDAAAAAWVRTHSSPALTQLMGAVSLMHSQVVLWAVGFALVLYTWRRGEPRWALLAFMAIPVGLLLNALLKLAFARARPLIHGAPSAYDTYSFPSGHSAGSTFVYGFLALYIASHTRSVRMRAGVFAAAVVMVLAVAASRLVLGVHFASDVTAGVAWAAVWVAAWSAALAPWRRRVEPHP